MKSHFTVFGRLISAKNFTLPAVFFTAAALVAGCATPRANYKAGYDFSSVRKVYIEEFRSVAVFENSGSVVRDAFISEFLRAGYAVTDDISSANAIVGGSVRTYNPEKRYLIMLQKPGEQRIVAQNLTEIPGSNLYSFGSAFGLKEDNQIIVSNAVVGISAQMRDASTREIVWSNDYTYEGLDLSTALNGLVRYLVKTVPK
ncbi:MAG: hypothetical protein CVU77_03375 [Elusimicrobia bacterium HGW-Elusimicrobia-1]|jgi:uncharacterized protein YbaA (DUF1428 family)|nr:MAG: hypothetical protein CVU77_03375 [Elusimicrobia bacterium HGW-Elusimicrobia-1]